MFNSEKQMIYIALCGWVKYIEKRLCKYEGRTKIF